MPQLDKVTFLSQFFWFTLIFSWLYLKLVRNQLPKMARILKIREALGTPESAVVDVAAKQIFQNYRSKRDHEQWDLLSTNYAPFLGDIQNAFQSANSLNEKESEKLLESVTGEYENRLHEYQTINQLSYFSLIRTLPPSGRPANFGAVKDSPMTQEIFAKKVNLWAMTNNFPQKKAASSAPAKGKSTNQKGSTNSKKKK